MTEQKPLEDKIHIVNMPEGVADYEAIDLVSIKQALARLKRVHNNRSVILWEDVVIIMGKSLMPKEVSDE